MGGGGRLITWSEVSNHSSFEDCWLVIDGKVYDVTKFLDDHPGGNLVILTGKDALPDFEDAGHTASARAIRDSFYVGDLDISSVTKPSSFHFGQLYTMGVVVKLLKFLVPLLMLGMAVATCFPTKSA